MPPVRVLILCALGVLVLFSAFCLAFRLGAEQSAGRVTASAQEVASLQQQMTLLTTTVAQLDEHPQVKLRLEPSTASGATLA